jgi:hypothetical protein
MMYHMEQCLFCRAEIIASQRPNEGWVYVCRACYNKYWPDGLNVNPTPPGPAANEVQQEAIAKAKGETEDAQRKLQHAERKRAKWDERVANYRTALHWFRSRLRALEAGCKSPDDIRNWWTPASDGEDNDNA